MTVGKLRELLAAFPDEMEAVISLNTDLEGFVRGRIDDDVQALTFPMKETEITGGGMTTSSVIKTRCVIFGYET